MNAEKSDNLAEATRRLVEGFDPERIILFGSQARGEAEDRSDIDLVVLFDRIDNRYETEARMIAALRGLRVPVDLISYTVAEFEREQSLKSAVARPAAREGTVLYERAA